MHGVYHNWYICNQAALVSFQQARSAAVDGRGFSKTLRDRRILKSDHARRAPVMSMAHDEVVARLRSRLAK